MGEVEAKILAKEALRSQKAEEKRLRTLPNSEFNRNVRYVNKRIAKAKAMVQRRGRYAPTRGHRWFNYGGEQLIGWWMGQGRGYLPNKFYPGNGASFKVGIYILSNGVIVSDTGDDAKEHVLVFEEETSTHKPILDASFVGTFYRTLKEGPYPYGGSKA